MKNQPRDITDFINVDVKEYAISVVEDRAIPSVVDGFKPVQRKIVFTANKVAKSFVKTAALVGNVISIGGYYKGDGSIAGAAGIMCQDFPGSNNYPWLEGKGEFGKRVTPDGISAPRYTKCRIHQNFSNFFKDNELLTYIEQEGEYFEPRYYFPVIPTVLLNGIQGIAVGFATKILPYNAKDVLQNVNLVLAGKEQKKMKPHWEGFKGTVALEEDQWVQYGVWRKINTSTLEISELPIGISRDKYVEHLNKLEERGDISSYDDLCKKEFRFVVHMKRNILDKWEKDGQVEQKFKLRQKLSENLTMISEEGKLIIFNDPREVIAHFVKFRMGIYAARRVHFIDMHNEKIRYLKLKALFIKMVMDGKIDFKKVGSKDDLRKKVINLMSKWEPTDEDIERLINTSIHQLNKEEISNIVEKIKEHMDVITYYEKTTEEEIYSTDLTELAKNLR